MNILIIGGGGREHALAWKLAQSPDVTKLYCAPGNPGIAGVAECVPIPVKEQGDLLKFAVEHKIDLTVVGPEDPLVGGIVDRFRKKGLRIFGPTARVARLEGSKAYAKELCFKNGIPTGYARTFHDYDLAIQHLNGIVAPIVVKADGLAAGKGVSVCKTLDEAREAVRRIMRERVFGDAGASVVLEEYLDGQEISILAVSDGHTIVPFEAAQDHKPIFDGDRGPNTGGMGTYSPLPQVLPEVIAAIERDVLVQAIHSINSEGDVFCGCLFAGLILTDDGPKVLEFNVRFGDPETQTLMRRLKSDLFPLLWRACDGTLDQAEIEWDPRPAVTVILAAGGYPGKVLPPARINGLESTLGEEVVVFHSGTKLTDGKLMTAGGRVLAVSALGDTIEDARARAYAAADRIEFNGKQVRRDIGYRALSSEAR